MCRELRRIDDACERKGVQWLRAWSDGPTMELGPLFDSREGACYRCFEKRMSLAPAPSPRRASITRARACSPGDRHAREPARTARCGKFDPLL